MCCLLVDDTYNYTYWCYKQTNSGRGGKFKGDVPESESGKGTTQLKKRVLLSIPLYTCSTGLYIYICFLAKIQSFL